MLKYATLDERMERWDAFYSDPDWLAIRRKTNGPSEIVERFDIYFLRPHDGFSCDAVSADGSSVDELRLANVPPGSKIQIDAFMRDVEAPLIERSGGKVLLAADAISGPSLPKIAVLTRWPDTQTWDDFRRASLAPFNLFPVGRPKIGPEELYLMTPL